MHPYAHVLIVFIHHVLEYLETCVDEAPFGFVSEKPYTVSWVDIPDNIDEPYSQYLHRTLANRGMAGVYGIWMSLKTDRERKDVVALTIFVRSDTLPFSIFIPVSEPNRWWIET